jgi:hypothetical protein
LTADPCDRFLRDIDGEHVLALRRQRQREAAVVTERVQQSARRVLRRGDAVLALIEEESRLLATMRIDEIGNRSFAHLDDVWHRAVEDFDPLFEPFQQPYAWIVPRKYPERPNELNQQLREFGKQSIDALRKRLHDQIVAIAIDDEGGQQICFAMNEAIRGRVDVQRFAKAQRLLEPRAPQR